MELKKDPAFQQRVENTLKIETPNIWDWARNVKQESALSDAMKDFEELSKEFMDKMRHLEDSRIAELQHKFGLSREEAIYAITNMCPFDRSYRSWNINVRYCRKQGSDTVEVEVPPYSGVDNKYGFFWLRKGDYAVCKDNHRWWVYQ